MKEGGDGKDTKYESKQENQRNKKRKEQERVKKRKRSERETCMKFMVRVTNATRHTISNTDTQTA